MINHIKNFCNQYNSSLINLFNLHVEPNTNLTFKNFVEALVENLSSKYYGLNNIDDLNSLFFYDANELVQSYVKKCSKKERVYICPGCLFYNKQTAVVNHDLHFKCNICAEKCKTSIDLAELELAKYYAKYNKSGYKCPECNRFIAAANSSTVTCPYPDCSFVGNASDCKKSLAPFKNNILSAQESASAPVHVERSTEFLILKKVIESQSSELSYKDWNFTVPHKILVYKAFNNLLDRFPSQMTDYLLHSSRSGGFQHKIFQEYISLLESSFPLIVRKNKKFIRIDSLLDSNLCLFEGISTFEGTVSSSMEVNNNTQEFYVGGRSATYAKPYYIGKLLDVVSVDSGQSLFNNVIEYSFLKIKMSNMSVGDKVIVTHLRVPPHYQMGGMVYVNRIRKNIIEGAR